MQKVFENMIFDQIKWAIKRVNDDEEYLDRQKESVKRAEEQLNEDMKIINAACKDFGFKHTVETDENGNKAHHLERGSNGLIEAAKCDILNEMDE